ncbi:SDR family NAD(P)-dependent oxidoreductase [Bdellovibrionota bacterium FG-1]
MAVLITGASSGIGEACARGFAAAGFSLVLVARRKKRLDAIAQEIRAKNGVEVHCFELDVRSKKAVQAWADVNAEVLKKIDVLVNNAGLASGRSPIQTDDSENWELMIDTNIKGLLYVTRAVLPGFIERGVGHVVNLGSVAGYWTYPQGAVYAATKFAVRALNEGMRQDLNGTGVRVTSIAPGMVETEFSLVRFGGDAEKAKSVYAGMTPLSATDVAEAILWCVQRPKHVNVQEMILFPTDQASVQLVHRK